MAGRDGQPLDRAGSRPDDRRRNWAAVTRDELQRGIAAEHATLPRAVRQHQLRVPLSSSRVEAPERSAQL